MMQAGTRVSRPLPLGLAATLAATLAGGVAAQNLSLDKVGGALGGIVSFPIHGQPGEAYALLLDIVEIPTPLPALGLTLDITDQFAWLTYGAPGWFGVTSASGDATPATACSENGRLEKNGSFGIRMAGVASPLALVTPNQPGAP